MEKLTCKYNMLFSSLGNTMEDDITASSAEVFSSEGRSVTLSCTYSVKANNLQWYRQDPGSAPQFLLLITDTTSPSVVEAKPPHPRLNATLNKEKNQVDLKIISAEVSDSAVYYCAVQPTVTGNTKTLYKNLWSKRQHNTPQHPLEGVKHCSGQIVERSSTDDEEEGPMM
uniref:Ig-like domain-containing protein n=1 Tax=Sander lucioperca TaxID=283035 RepID=A0A8D0B0A2_SANLU